MGRGMLAVAVVGSLIGVAHAQESSPEGAADEASPTTDEASTDDEARRVFQLGASAQEDGRFDDAARYFERAYQLSPRPELLYNVGIALERADRPEDAVVALQRYLEAGEDLPRRVEVEERIRTLEARIEEERLARERAAAARASEGPGAAPWILLGGGGALVATGAVFLGLAAKAASNVEDAPRDTRWADVEDDADRADTFGIVGGVLLGVGGAALVGGLIWAIVGGGESDTEVGVGPGSVLVRGRF